MPERQPDQLRLLLSGQQVRPPPPRRPLARFSDTQYTWQTFQQLFGGFFRHFASFAPGKPQLVTETATNSGLGALAEGVGSAATYINGMRSYLKNTAGPKYDVIGVCWFDTNTDNNVDWRVNQTPSAYRAWLALARDRYFGGAGP